LAEDKTKNADIVEEVDLSPLFKARVRVENRIRPTSDAQKKFAMSDGNRRTIDGALVLEAFWEKVKSDGTLIDQEDFQSSPDCANNTIS